MDDEGPRGFEEVERRLVQTFQLNEKGALRLSDALKGFLTFRRLGAHFLESSEFFQAPETFWAEFAQSLQAERGNTKALLEDRNNGKLARMDERLRDHRRKAREHLNVVVRLATLGHAEAVALGHAFAHFWRSSHELPVTDRLRAVGLVR